MGTVNGNKNRVLIGIEVTLCLLAVAIPLVLRSQAVPVWTRAVLVAAGFKLLLYAGILWVSLYLNDLYHLRVLTDKRRLLPSLAKASLVAVVLYALASAIMPDWSQGRVVFGAALGTVTGILLIQYKFFRPYLEARLKQERVLVLGDSAIGNAIRQELRGGDYQQKLIDDPGVARDALRWIRRAGEARATRDHALDEDEQFRYLKETVDVIVLALDNVPFPARKAVSLTSNTEESTGTGRGRLRLASQHADTYPPADDGADDTDVAVLMRGLVALKLGGIPITGGLDYYERLTGRVYLGEPAGPLFFSHERYTIDKLSLAIKDVWERLLALTIFLMAIPFLILVPIAIYLESGRPLLFVQKRVGRGGRPYNLYKWRSMTDGREVTRVGRVIRKTKLDELPQLINVLMGDMALVGPRPELPQYVDKFAEGDCYYNLRHIVKPGLTGWAQIMFPNARAEDAMTKLSYDLYYVKHFSLVSDMVIMVETFKMIVFGNRRTHGGNRIPGPMDPPPTEPENPTLPVIRAHGG